MTARKKKDDPGRQDQPEMVREVASATWHILGEGDRTMCGRVIRGQVERQAFSSNVQGNTHVCKTCQRAKLEAS